MKTKFTDTPTINPLKSLLSAVKTGNIDMFNKITDNLYQEGVTLSNGQLLKSDGIIGEAVRNTPLTRAPVPYNHSEIDDVDIWKKRTFLEFMRIRFLDIDYPHDGKPLKLIQIAVLNNDPRMIQTLCEEGVSLNVQDENGHGLVKFAIQNNKLNCLASLVEEGCNGNELDRKKETPLFNAIQEKNLETVTALHRAGINFNFNCRHTSPFSKACADGGVDIVRFFTNEVAIKDINAVDLRNKTPLNYAMEQEGNEEVIELLISKGARTREDLERKRKSHTPVSNETNDIKAPKDDLNPHKASSGPTISNSPTQATSKRARTHNNENIIT